MGRSAAYWATNLYLDARQEPRPSAPYRDLPPLAAQRFRQLREALQKLPDVVEHVRFMGATWRWTWEYGLGTRRVCWVHLMNDGISSTFTVSDNEERQAMALAKLAAPIVSAIRYGQKTGPVRWCWIELSDRKVTEAFLGFARRKVGWLQVEAAAATPAARRKAAG
ncbi:MAG: hypothetical protein ACREL4_01810 [Gemmatimonadales bacterium]